MGKPKVSVIMTVKNGEKRVGKTIESILDQSFQDFELIMVDDYSDDSTWEILQQYEKQDARIVLIKNAKWEGKCISRNKALKKARGEYIAITDGDDISMFNRFAKEVVYLDTHQNCFLVGSRAEIQDETGRKIGVSWGAGYDGDISDMLETSNRLVHSSVMFRNTQKYQYREKFTHSQDYDLFLQMLLDNKQIHLLEDILVIYHTKRDLDFNEYLVKQAYFAEAAKYLFREKKYNYNDLYEKFDNTELEQYVPDKVLLEMKMKNAFFGKKFKEARKYLEELMNIDPSTEWRVYYLDTFFHGNLRKIAKKLKRGIIRSK